MPLDDADQVIGRMLRVLLAEAGGNFYLRRYGKKEVTVTYIPDRSLHGGQTAMVEDLRAKIRRALRRTGKGKEV